MHVCSQILVIAYYVISFHDLSFTILNVSLLVFYSLLEMQKEILYLR